MDIQISLRGDGLPRQADRNRTRIELHRDGVGGRRDDAENDRAARLDLDRADVLLQGIAGRSRSIDSDLDLIVEASLKKAALWDEVKDKLKQSGQSLSGGQQQRLCIARTMAVEPKIILMDEPCSALDPAATSKIETLIGVLKEKYTVIVVTHNLQQALRVSDFTAFMYVGELVEFNDTKVLFEKPRSELTANYINGKFG